MSSFELMALAVALLSGAKLIAILVNPSSWDRVVEFILKKPRVTMVVSFLIALISLSMLLESLTIIDIFATMFFFMALMIMGYAAYPKELKSMAKNVLADKTLVKRSWPLIVLWSALLVWVFAALFLP